MSSVQTLSQPSSEPPTSLAGSLARFRGQLERAPIVLDLEAERLEDAVKALAQALIDGGQLELELREEVIEAVMNRETESSTALGDGVAVPHAFLRDLERPRLAVARLKRPLEIDAPDGEPTRFLFLLLGGKHDGATHLEFLMAIARLQGDRRFAARADQAASPEAWLDAVDDYIERAERKRKRETLRPDGLDARGFAMGLVADVRRRLPHYASDFRDGLNAKSVAATMFLFFACVAPAVAFGGLMAELTGGAIGAMEMIIATAVGGLIYAFFAGQPLTILGGTGPLLVFTAMTYELCTRVGLPFLPVYAWVGLWTAAFTIIAALTNASALIRYCTRFTDEIFALLISIIFIYEAVKNVLAVFSHESVDDHSALMSLVLAIATFWIAISLRNMRSSRYLRGPIRQFLADFGSVIAIGAATAGALFLHEKGLPSLAVPDAITTTSGRPWRVDLFALPGWAIAATALPALLCTVLVFLDQNITARLVNQSGHKLDKGAAYHHDLFIVGALIGAFSLFGLPWLVAATVRSLNHIRALADVDEVVRSDGSRTEQITSVRENRVTGIGIHLLIGLSVLLFPWLTRNGVEIPMAALFGLFLYMGVTSLGGNQFFERVKLWLMDPELYPRTHYVRNVPMRTIHLFTAVQLGGLALLWLVKASSLALLFPLFIALLVPLRLVLDRRFQPAHLAALDSEEEPEDELYRESE